MEIYLVGGAVRDRLLDLSVKERDWVVVGATEEEMLAAGYTRADAEFPVFLHPETGEEYALARTETKSGPGYKGFEIYAGSDVSLEQDLLRRDLTVNALAMDAEGELIDICDGREDLDEGLLRHVTPAFVEDPVRLLRVARFAAKLGRWGFRLAHGTHGLLKKMAASDDLLALTPERVHREMWKALGEDQPWRFFAVLQRCGALQRLLPELSSVMGEQGSHRVDAAADAMAPLKRAVRLTTDPGVRFAVAMFPAAERVGDAGRFIAGLRVDRSSGQLLRDLLQQSPLVQQGTGPEQLLLILRQLKPETQPRRLENFVLAARALWPAACGRLARDLDLARQVVGSTDVASLRDRGLTGAALGQALAERRLAALRERLAAISSQGG